MARRLSLITFLLFCTLLVPPASFSVAQTDLESELQAKQAAKQALEAELQKDLQKLNEISGQKNTLDKAVKELDATTKKLGTEVKITENKIGETDLRIKNLNLSIQEKQRRVESYKDLIGQGIRQIHEDEGVPFILHILKEENLSEIIRQTDERVTLNKNLRVAINDLEEEKNLLEEDREKREENKKELEEYKEEVHYQKEEVDKTKQQKSSLLNETKKQESEYQKIVEEKRKLQAQFEDELAAIEAKIQFNLDPNSYPKAKHGVLAWPLENVLITQGFGLTKDSEALYSYRSGQWSGKHTGVDFRANNDKVYAMSDGTVIGFGNTDGTCPRASFGGWMLIQYDNGLSSIYSHLSSFVAQKGSRVKAGTLVAYSGNTGYSTGPHLDVKVVPATAVSIQTWPSKGCPGKNYTTPLVANSTYLNPLGYLPKATDAMFK